MAVIDLNEYRQRLVDVEREALEMDDSLAELYAINGGDLEGELESIMELARQMVYPPLYCVKSDKTSK